MKQFLLGAAVATAVLGAAGFAVFKEPTATVAVKKTVPLKLSDLTLDRAVRCPIVLTDAQPVFVATMPSTMGFVMTSMKFIEGLAPVDIAVGSCVERQNSVTSTYTSAPDNSDTKFDPPIVVAPGSTITITKPAGTSFYDLKIVIGGYVVYPGEV